MSSIVALLLAANGAGGHPGTNTAFKVVFGIFLAALVVLSVITLRWAIRRDRKGLAEWRRQRAALAFGTEPGPGPDGEPGRANGTVAGNGAAPDPRPQDDPP